MFIKYKLCKFPDGKYGVARKTLFGTTYVDLRVLWDYSDMTTHQFEIGCKTSCRSTAESALSRLRGEVEYVE